MSAIESNLSKQKYMVQRLNRSQTGQSQFENEADANSIRSKKSKFEEIILSR
jgi:hypothetical protein